MKKKLEKVFQSIMAFIMKARLWVLLLTFLITLFFTFSLKNLVLDTNVFGFASNLPPSEVWITPEEEPKKKLKYKNLDIDIKEIKKSEVATIPNRENSFSIEEYENPIPYKEVEPILNPYQGEKDKGGYRDGYVIIFSSEKMFDPVVLDTIYSVMSNLEKRYEIGPCFSPFDYVTVEKKGTRLSIVPISPVKKGEKWTEHDAQVFRERLMNDSIAKNYLYSSDGHTIMIYYRAKGLNNSALKELDTIVNPLRQYGRVALNGGGLITDAVTSYINRDLFLLIILCFLVILAVFYFSFHSFKGVVISSLVSVIGLIWTLGTMALSGYALTIVTILTPCLVLTLGSSYSVHMLSQYYVAYNEGDEKNLSKHFSSISKTIFFAMLTTVAGFLALLICRTDLFKELGITISIGIVYCWILSMTLIPALLSIVKKPSKKSVEKVSSGFFSKLIGNTAKAVTSYWYIFIVLFVGITIFYILVKPKVGFDSNYMSYFPSKSVISQDSKYFAKTLGGTDPYYLTIYAPEGEDNFFLKAENLKDVYAYEAAIQAACPDIVQVLSFSQYVSFLNKVYNGEDGIPDSNGLILLLSRTLSQIKNMIGSNVLDALISPDGNTITLSMRNYDFVEQDLQTTSSLRRLNDTLEYYTYMLPKGTKSQVSSLASENLRGSTIIMEDQNKAMILSLILTFIIASIATVSFYFGLSTLIPVFVGVMVIYIIMWSLGMNFDIVTAGFSSIAIGCGVDDAIHFLIRLKNNKKKYKEDKFKEVIFRTILETGRPIILTTVSIDAGLLMLAFASFLPVRYFGILMCVALSATMIATLTILPSVLILIDLLVKRIKKKSKKMQRN